jgi:glutaredoxin-like protein NrdH
LNAVTVPGDKKDHKVLVYALSTCAWCKRTKQFLKDRKVHYEYLDVDLADAKDQREIENELRKWNCRAFPAVLIDGKRLVVGFKENELKEVLGLR